ncbi:hypothetical protein [Clostridium botulinum]|uniref:hypothetical protein n=1 Tax=Clostridium botulinum TaxID=1491 RepID=UPI0007DF1536|nr:hypothetical protein [Clostridium botulinum]KEI75922.1 hypothetical protein N486_09180 [Clostridium botulinum B2 128]KEI92068.1 hypothetical protein N491_09330 [Clostridium botulinum B2 275]
MGIKILIAFIFLFLYKLVSNISYFFRIKHLYEGYSSYIKGENSNFTTNKKEIINLFKKAGIKDSYIPASAPLGFNQIATYKASIFTNILTLTNETIFAVSGMFNEAIGIFRYKIFETFNPLYWIDLIIFLPKNMFEYLGVGSEKVLVKIFQIIWWIVSPLAILFREDTLVLIKHCLSSFH